MEMKYPFIYISGLPRTGSTMLSEALTCLPYAYVLHEPHLGKNYLAIQKNDAASLMKYGLDLNHFASWRLVLAFFWRRLRAIGIKQDFMISQFKSAFLPKFFSIAGQLGVKEIKHEGWQNYIRHFPTMKVVMIGRDPMDVYISYFKRWQRKTIAWRGPFDPERVAEFYMRQFRMQIALIERADSMTVRYEDICRNPELLADIKEFVQSPIPGLGEIGAFVSTHEFRKDEHTIHGAQVTSESIFRWKDEKNQDLLRAARRFCDRMQHYNQFWGYEHKVA